MNWNRMGRLLGAALFTGVVLTLPAQAGPIKGFSGYTRPGYSVRADDPAQDPAKQDFLKAVAAKATDLKREPGMGCTVYYMVIDRVDGTVEDPWGLGLDLAKAWQAGREAEGARASMKLDTKARYLYLYQIINDSGEPAQIKSATIRLLVDPEYITSWGWVGERRDLEGRSVGFSMEFSEEKSREGVRAVSTASPGVTDREYRPLAPAFAAPRPYGVLPIHLGNIRQAASKQGEKDDTGREPEQVHLLNEVSDSFGTLVSQSLTPNPVFGFQGEGDAVARLRRPIVPSLLIRSERNRLVDAFQPLTVRGVGYNPYAPLTLTELTSVVETSAFETTRTLEDPLTRIMTVAEQSNRAWPALRAYWLDAPLKPGERSGLFGFTSNLPPMYDKVRVRANRVRGVGVAGEAPVIGAAGGAPDVRPANLAATGTVPVPVPPLEEVAGVSAAAGTTLGSLGGGGGGGGGGGPQGGGGGGFPGLGGGAGGGLGGGIGGGQGTTGTTTGTENPNTTDENQDQNQRGGQTQSVVVRVVQQQGQQQQQGQIQINKNTNKGCCCCDPNNNNVIPEPAALLTTALCLPVLSLFYRRRKPKVEAEQPVV